MGMTRTVTFCACVQAYVAIVCAYEYFQANPNGARAAGPGPGHAELNGDHREIAFDHKFEWERHQGTKHLCRDEEEDDEKNRSMDLFSQSLPFSPSHNTSDPTIAASETIASGCDPEVTTPLSDTTDDDETVQGTAACMPDDVVAAVPAAGSLGLLGGLLGL